VAGIRWGLRRRWRGLVVLVVAVGSCAVAPLAAGVTRPRPAEVAPAWDAVADMVGRVRTAVLARIDAEAGRAGRPTATAVRRRVEDRLLAAERRIRGAHGRPSPDRARAVAAQLISIEATFRAQEEPTIEAAGPTAALRTDVAAADAVAADVAAPGGTVDLLLSEAVVPGDDADSAQAVAAAALPTTTQPAVPPSHTPGRDVRGAASRAGDQDRSPAGSSPDEPAQVPQVEPKLQLPPAPVTEAAPVLPGTVRSIEAEPASAPGGRVPHRLGGLATGTLIAALVAGAGLRLRRQRRHLMEVLG